MLERIRAMAQKSGWRICLQISSDMHPAILLYPPGGKSICIFRPKLEEVLSEVDRIIDEHLATETLLKQEYGA